MNQEFSLPEYLKDHDVRILVQAQVYGISIMEGLRTLPKELVADFLLPKAHKRWHKELSMRRNGRIALRTQLLLSKGEHIALEDELESLNSAPIK